MLACLRERRDAHSHVCREGSPQLLGGRAAEARRAGAAKRDKRGFIQDCSREGCATETGVVALETAIFVSASVTITRLALRAPSAGVPRCDDEEGAFASETSVGSLQMSVWLLKGITL